MDTDIYSQNLCTQQIYTIRNFVEQVDDYGYWVGKQRPRKVSQLLDRFDKFCNVSNYFCCLVIQ